MGLQFQSIGVVERPSDEILEEDFLGEEYMWLDDEVRPLLAKADIALITTEEGTYLTSKHNFNTGTCGCCNAKQGKILKVEGLVTHQIRGLIRK